MTSFSPERTFLVAGSGDVWAGEGEWWRDMDFGRGGTGAGWGDGWFDVREEVGWGRVGPDGISQVYGL